MTICGHALDRTGRHAAAAPRGRAAARSRRFAGWLVVLVLAVGLRAAEVIPPAPANHFNDYAGVVPPAAAAQLNAELARFERDSSNQILVAIFPRMQSDSSIEDYTVRVAEKWGAGGRQRDNGAVLFVFVADRSLYIQVGYGLEGSLPDARCKQIIEDIILPRFRQGDYPAGIAAGVQAMIAAAKGEYAGTGRLAREGGRTGNTGIGGWAVVLLLLLLVFPLRNARRGTVYGRGGRRSLWVGGPGRWGGGGFGGGGGGTFSGGGGSFGGGGAGGRW